MWSWWLICFKDPLAGDDTLPSCHCLSIHRSKHIAVASSIESPEASTHGAGQNFFSKSFIHKLQCWTRLMDCLSDAQSQFGHAADPCCSLFLPFLQSWATCGEPSNQTQNPTTRSYDRQVSGKEWNCISRKESQLSSKWEPPKKINLCNHGL